MKEPSRTLDTPRAATGLSCSKRSLALEDETRLGNLLNAGDALRAVKGCEILYHLAANPEVRISAINPKIHFVGGC
jgi:nucleoside-diphosphate-sugar epimerase